MATRKRNEYLDAEESEEEERSYDSDAEESRSRMLPRSKRQKAYHNSEEEDQIDEQDQELHDDDDDDYNHENEEHCADFTGKDNAELARLEKLAAGLPSDLKLQSTKLGKALPPPESKKDKSGVIYLSRVPPFMKPTVLRSLLTPYGTVGRIFLTPEPSTSRTQRLRNGGTRRKLFLDGWVEFRKKKDAKFVAENLNAQTMGGKKRGRWHDEVWNIKYLSGVKWSHLVEQIQNENAERAARLRFEIQQGKKENKTFLANVERGKMLNGIEATRKKRGEDLHDQDANGGEAAMFVSEHKARDEKLIQRKGRLEFTQHAATSKALKMPEPGQDVHRVLSSMM